jgi:cytochrome P450
MNLSRTVKRAVLTLDRDFDESVSLLMFNFLPSVIAAAGNRARRRLQEIFIPFYNRKADLDPTVSEITRARAAVLRNHGISDDEIGRVEISLFWAATVNTIPTLYWFLVYIWSQRDVVVQLRKEVEALVHKRAGDEVVINVSALEETCPLLMSSYHETMRLCGHAVSFRKGTKDVVLTDGKGNSYLLKKDVAVQIAIGAAHWRKDIWGADAEDFRADRFLNHSGRKDESDEERLRRLSFLPFGGGRHLCPGRNFAFMENLSFMATLLLGYEVSAQDGQWNLPRYGSWNLSDAVTKPVNAGAGLGLTIIRRKGWENVKWRYEYL